MKKVLTALLLSAAASFNTLAQTITVDNEDPGFSIVEGNWTPSTFVGGFLGNDYVNTGDATTFSEVQWQLNTNANEEYEVSARWTARSNRTSIARYVITHADGISSIEVNQRNNGGEFVTLGTFRNPTLIQLNNIDIDGFVVADAVRATPLSELGTDQPLGGLVFGDRQHPLIDGTEFLADTVYEAESDGIVTILTGGNCTNYYAFEVGFEEDSVSAVLGQIAQNGGFSAPVRKDTFWRLRRGGGSNAGQCTILIGFLPILGN